MVPTRALGAGEPGAECGSWRELQSTDQQVRTVRGLCMYDSERSNWSRVRAVSLLLHTGSFAAWPLVTQRCTVERDQWTSPVASSCRPGSS